MTCLDLTEETIRLTHDYTKGGITLLTAYSLFSTGSVDHIIVGQSRQALSVVDELHRGARKKNEGTQRRYLSESGVYHAYSHIYDVTTAYEREVKFNLMWDLEEELLSDSEECQLTIEFLDIPYGTKLRGLDDSIVELQLFHRITVPVKRVQPCDLRTLNHREHDSKVFDYTASTTVFDAIREGYFDDLE